MQGIDQSIDGGQRIFSSQIGQVRIARGCGWAGMTKQVLDMAQAQATLKQMSGKAVT